MRNLYGPLGSGLGVLALVAVVAVAAGARLAGADDCVPTGGDPRVCAGTHSLVVSERYLLAVHAASPGSTFAEHETYLLESADGVEWAVVSGWQPYLGSVPEVIVRDDLLYLFNPGKRRVYDLEGGTVAGSAVAIVDTGGAMVSYVDPSAILDAEGEIVLFFLNSTGVPVGTDPAAGSDPKDFDSATENSGSLGIHFTMEEGPRVAALGSDPDIFFDGSRFVLYISYGSNTRAYSSAALHGDYEAFPGLGSEALLTEEGGVPAGHYDSLGEDYWTYVHAFESGANVVRLALHDDFSNSIPSDSFITVVDAVDLGLGASTSVESPSFLDREALAPVALPSVRPPGLSLLAALMVLGGLRRSWRGGVPVRNPGGVQAEPCSINSSIGSPCR